MESKLHLSLDALVSFRGLRTGRQPDPSAVAALAALGGADWVGLSLGAPGQGATHRDAEVLRETVACRLDLALAPALDLVSTAFDIRPDRVTLVPERRGASVSLGGLDAQLLKDSLKKHVSHLKDAEIEVGVRIEPDLEQVKAIHRLDADVAVLRATGFCEARSAADRRTEWTRLTDAATLGRRLGLRVAVAGGLDLVTIEALARNPQVEEFHVGHACLARAFLQGAERAVEAFVSAIAVGRRQAF